MTSLDTRSVDRDSMFLMADIVFDPGLPGERVKVRNLSAGGMMIEGEIKLTRGARVAIELRNIGAIAGTVVWVRSPRYGIAFEEEIDPRKARSEVFGGPRQAPIYARSVLPAPQYDASRGKLRPV